MLRETLALACFKNSKRVWLKLDIHEQMSLLDSILAEIEGPWWATELASEGHELRKALAEKDAQIAALQEWRNAALRVGEDLASDGPDGYYNFTARQYLDWALARLRETPAPPQEPQDPRYKHILSSDYYMPGHKNETQERETHMTDPIIDVQTTLDDWLASNPEAQKYVRKIYYVPDGAQIPRDVTHMNRLTSIDYPDLELRLGVVATLATATLANLILGILERTADDPKA